MKQKSTRGSVAVMILVGLTVLLTISLGVSGLSLANLREGERSTSSVLAYQAAEAGIELETARAVAALYANKGAFKVSNDNLSADLSSILDGCTASASVIPTSDPTYGYITCTVKSGHFTRSIRQLVNAHNISIWNNAIFAGTGASGQQINGNVNIRGSVHTLGDGEDYIDAIGSGSYFGGDPYTDSNHNGKWDPGEPFTDRIGDHVYHGPDPYNDTNGNGVYDPPLTSASLDATLSGNADIGNTYSGMPMNLLTCIPNCPTLNGVQSLSAEVRVKHGKISLSGSAEIGDPGPINGGTMKATVDGVYVNDGFTGSAGTGSVHSDNGTANQYDLGYLGIQFPLISGIGAPQYVDKNGTMWTTQQTYLDARSLTIPVSTITASTAAFSYGPDAYGDSIRFAPSTHSAPATLTINGIIRIAGNLQIGAKDQIFYQGSGTLYSTGNINIDGDLLPVSGLVFPTTTRIGVLAAKNMNLASGNGSSQLTMAGAFYAQGDITSQKQNNIAGTFVADFFNMGVNVPSIWQVPALVYNMPPGMPGDKQYLAIRTKSWRERAIKPDDAH